MRKRVSGHLYFMFNPVTGLVKIGIATDVENRRRGLSHANGVHIRLLTVYEGQARLEKPLHEAFHDQRQVGEWFLPHEDILRLAFRDEDPAAVLDRYKDRIETHRRAIVVKKEAEREAERQHREAEAARLKAIHEEKRRVSREIAVRRAERQRKHEEKESARLTEERRRVEAERQRWTSKDREHLRGAVLRQQTNADWLEAEAMERAKRVREHQRARNAAILGVQEVAL